MKAYYKGSSLEKEILPRHGEKLLATEIGQFWKNSIKARIKYSYERIYIHIYI